MKLLVLTTLIAVAIAAPAAAATGTERLGPRLGPLSSTAYCLYGTMASGLQVHVGAVASNAHRLGTLIKLSRRVNVGGRRKRYFRVLDRIGYGTALDIWMPSCGAAIQYGRRGVSYRVVRRR